MKSFHVFTLVGVKSAAAVSRSLWLEKDNFIFLNNLKTSVGVFVEAMAMFMLWAWLLKTISGVLFLFYGFVETRDSYGVCISC